MSKHTGFNVRHAVEADTPSLLQMSAALAALDEPGIAIELPPDGKFLVAVAPSVVVLGGTIIGQLCTRIVIGVLIASHLYVTPSWRRRGVGTALVKSLDGHYAEINVFERNRIAMLFWERQGFRRITTVKRPVPPGIAVLSRHPDRR